MSITPTRVLSTTSTLPHSMKQKDFALSFCQSRARQSATVLGVIAKRFTHRHTSKSIFGTTACVTAVEFSYALQNQQVNLLLNRSNRIAASDFNFNFNRFSDKEALLKFRFRIEDIVKLVPILSWPSGKRYTSRNRYGVSPILATCIVLRRIAVPDRWEDLCLLFGKHPSQMSEIFWEAIDYFVSAQGLLILGQIPRSYIENRAEAFSKAIRDGGAALSNCVGFIDGTVVGISRPTGYMKQLVVYNGHKRKHSLKFQAVNSSDGMILHAYGPVEGRRHDWFMYVCSGLEINLRSVLHVNGRQYVIYGDSEYNWRPFMEVPFQGSNLNANQRAFNASMSKSRITVEWIFKEVKMYLPVVDNKRKMKLWESPVGLLYISTMVLCNLRNCIYPNQISAYFGVSPPSLDEYLKERGMVLSEE